jgi:hypothetical protein
VVIVAVQGSNIVLQTPRTQGDVFPEGPLDLLGHEASSLGFKLCHSIVKEHKTSKLC